MRCDVFQPHALAAVPHHVPHYILGNTFAPDFPSLGPIVRFPVSSKITPFGHLLFGGAHLNANGLGLSGSDNSFSWAMGGGVDANVHPNIAIRLAQADWLRTQFVDSTQSNFRYSVGLVFKY